MQRIDGRFIYAASDLNNYLECAHLTELDRLVALGEKHKPDHRDASADLIARKGDEHEQRHLAHLQERYGGGVTIFDRPQHSLEGFAQARDRTIAAMERGDALIYQGTFFDGVFLGHPDFLRRVDTPSKRWRWNYEVIDTKLALTTKPYFLIQICNYSAHVANITGTAPEYGHIVLGSGEERSFRLDDYAAYYRHVKNRFLARMADLGETYPYETQHCTVCKWSEECAARRDRDDHLSLVAGIRRDQIKKLESSGIHTLAQLAAAGKSSRPKRMAEATYANLRSQAATQHKQREVARLGERAHFFEFRPRADEQSGFARLPLPDAGDVFFDIEGDPLYRPDRSLEYLWGYYLPFEDRYDAIWATDASREQTAFEQFVDMLMERRKVHPGMHVYHYAAYEVSALKRLMGRYASRENEVNELLRSGMFVDLYEVVRQGLWISQPSYSIKKMEAFYEFARSAQTKRGDDSIVMFETWLATHEAAILDDIRLYNDEDCRSTYQLLRWLLARREELAAASAEPLTWRPADLSSEDAREQKPDEVSETERELLAGIPAPDSPAALRDWNEDLRARWILGNLQRYHKREQRPDWWKYFDRLSNVVDLEEHDSEAIGNLRHRADIASFKNGKERNAVHTFEFPAQEYNIRGTVICPDTKKSAGEIVHIDGANRLLQLKLSAKIEPQRLRAIIPRKPIPDDKKRAALERIGHLYISGKLQSRHPALLDMLLARAPRFLDGVRDVVQPTEVTPESVSELVQHLDGSYLFVQGPPGSGKSTVAAAAIVDLLQRGKRVGVTANSHKAVHNVLRKIEEVARERGVRFEGCHKESGQTEGSAYVPLPEWPMIVSLDDGTAMADTRYRLVGGTTFALADDGLVNGFDYVFIDEGGQVCLADALVAARTARNVVLLGDPNQLPHVSKGFHPDGIAASILTHLCGAHATVPADRGVFLDRSYRLQTEICSFVSEAFYEGRLQASPKTARNAVHSPGLCGSGLAYLPIEHEGNKNRSGEEAARIVTEIRLLLQGSVTVREETRRTTEDDILVVAPYNQQRIRIEQLLHDAGFDRIRVGTVDKFQGQEAPVVFYSMAVSSAEHVPRGLEFLFDRNRFNVAISRAQCLAVLVCAPALMDARCSKIEQMALVNTLCRYAEAANEPPSGMEDSA